MKEFIEKLIGRLEELPTKAITRYKGGTFGDYEGTDYFIDKYKTKDIINELTEEYKPKTQADKIRSMSDEELAELFTKLAWNSEVQTTPLKYLDWLQSEAE